MTINGHRLIIEGNALRIANLEQEWYEDIQDPKTFVNELAQTEAKADVLSFWQRLPDTQPKYSYSMETEPTAALTKALKKLRRGWYYASRPGQ